MSLSFPARVVLVGFMGAGKTTVGRALARRLRWEFVDMDERIEARLGCSIAACFQAEGEGRFRREELSVAAEIQALHDHVVAAGGGAFAQDATRRLLARDAFVVWLRCGIDEIVRRVGSDPSRPLASGREAMERLLAQRETSYGLADLAIDTENMGSEGVAAAISRALPASGRQAATA
jgi:shikimate kinase